jgi:hypothetical protein
MLMAASTNDERDAWRGGIFFLDADRCTAKMRKFAQTAMLQTYRVLR